MFESVQNMSDILSDHEVQKNLYIVKGEAIEKFHHIIRFAKRYFPSKNRVWNRTMGDNGEGTKGYCIVLCLEQKGKVIGKCHHILHFAKNMKQYNNIIIFSCK